VARRAVRLIFLIAAVTSRGASAETRPPAVDVQLASLVRAFGATDFLTAKIALDRLIDPKFKSALVQQEVSRLAENARTFAGPHASEGAKFDAVRKVLYQAGPWNDNRPFAYDQSDPFGQNVGHKLLSEYLRTRLGNCVTMPTLFMLVGRGIGLHLTLTDAPLHMLVRYTHAGLPALNIEATSGGGFARTEWIRKNLPMSDRAVESGLYFRTHTDRETIALMATTVMDYLTAAGRNEEAIKVADAILAVDPKDGYTMVRKGTAIAAILKSEFYDKYPTPASIPNSLKARYLELAATNKKAFDDAAALGWEPSS
jgi:regulator of sirC expression with transglutaminase-like and TPR domain